MHGKVHSFSDVNPYITKKVVQSVLSSPTLCADMLCASSQQYEDVNVLRVDEDTIFGGATMRASEPRYASFFRDVQLRDKKLTAGFTTCHEAGGVTLLGYVPYLTSSMPMGGELVYAFYNKHTQSVAIVVTASAALERNAKQLIANLGKLHSFSPVCSFCGSDGSLQALRSCPCKGVQYCNASCQKQHWKAHKLQCSK
jgi:hypothetical protein